MRVLTTEQLQLPTRAMRTIFPDPAAAQPPLRSPADSGFFVGPAGPTNLHTTPGGFWQSGTRPGGHVKDAACRPLAESLGLRAGSI